MNKFEKIFVFISLPLLISFGIYMAYSVTVSENYNVFCLKKRSKIALGTFKGYYNSKGIITAKVSYKFNGTFIENENIDIIRSQENLRCYNEARVNLFYERPYSCIGDTVKVVYDSLNSNNCFIIGMSKIPKPDEFYRSLFEWYERKFVPKEKWCVCEE